MSPTIARYGIVQFDQWCTRYKYFIDSIFNNVQYHLLHEVCHGDPVLADETYNWQTMHTKLRKYLYTCSDNRFRTYRMYV